MCLGIPGEIVGIDADHPHLATVDVKGVNRLINIGLLDEDPPKPGEWILIHMGFALSRMDETEASSAMEFLEDVGGHYQALEDEIAAFRESLAD